MLDRTRHSQIEPGSRLSDDDERFNKLDQSLRDEFTRAFPLGEDPTTVLGALRPQMRQARQRRRAGLTASVAAIVVLATGLTVSLGQLRGASDRIVTEPAVSGGDVPSAVEEPIHDDERPRPPMLSGDAEEPTTETDTNPIEDQPADPSEEGSQSDPGAGSEPSQSAETVPAGETVPANGTTATTAANPDPPAAPAPTTLTTSTTAATSSASQPPTVIDSVCGSITVQVIEDGLELTDVNPKGSADPDVKNAGPEEVEVSFEGGEHCELKARLHNAQIVASGDIDDDDNDDDNE